MISRKKQLETWNDNTMLLRLYVQVKLIIIQNFFSMFSLMYMYYIYLEYMFMKICLRLQFLYNIYLKYMYSQKSKNNFYIFHKNRVFTYILIYIFKFLLAISKIKCQHFDLIFLININSLIWVCEYHFYLPNLSVPYFRFCCGTLI